MIPDVHCKPKVNNQRLRWLSKFVVDRKPDVIVQLGDWGDFPSLSSYDKGKASFEGRRFRDDVNAYKDGNKQFSVEIAKYNYTRKLYHEKQYKPRMIKLRGNHEERILRAVQYSPELEGTLSYELLQDEMYGWETHNFLDIVSVDGILYSHYFTSGNSSTPIAGLYPAASMLRQNMASCVAGHSHIRDMNERTAGDGRRLLALSAGCYFEHYEDWATPKQNDMWWRGVVVLHGVDGKGYFDPEFVSLARIKERYA